MANEAPDLLPCSPRSPSGSEAVQPELQLCSQPCADQPPSILPCPPAAGLAPWGLPEHNCVLGRPLSPLGPSVVSHPSTASQLNSAVSAVEAVGRSVER